MPDAMFSSVNNLPLAACLLGLVAHAGACAGDLGDGPDQLGGVDAGAGADPSTDQPGDDVTEKAVTPGRFAGRFSSPSSDYRPHIALQRTDL